MNPRYKAILGSLVPVVIAVTATGCGTQQGPATQGSSSVDRPVAFRDAAVHAAARRVYEKFAGTQEQRNAGEVLRAYAGNGAMDACLEQRGFPEWAWSSTRGYSAPYDPLTPTVWFAEPGDRVLSNNEIASGPYLLAEAEMNSDEGRSPEYEAAIDECLVLVPPASDADLARAGQPQGTARLVNEWRQVMAEAGTRRGGNVTAYFECMDSSAIPALSSAIPALKKAGTGFDEIGPLMATLAGQAGPPPKPGADPSTYSDAWLTFLDQEGVLVDADVACREDVYRRGIGGMARGIADFESRNASDISEAEAGWIEITAKAAELGYDGRPGPLGG